MFSKSKDKKVPVVEEKKKDDDWMTKKWRPMMAMMYMISCLFDFVVFPIMFTVVQFWETSVANDAFRQWAPITLQGGGLFHVAMGAVLGVSAYGRTQEKLNGATNAPSSPLSGGMPAPMSTPTAGQFGNSMSPFGGFGGGAPTPTAFGGNNNMGGGFNGTSAQDFQQPVTVTVGFGGKAAPPAAPQPLI